MFARLAPLGFFVFAACQAPEPQTDTFAATAKGDPTAEAAPAEPAAPVSETPAKQKLTFTASPKGKPEEGEGDPLRRSGPYAEPAPVVGDPEIHFIKVGQGDATLLQLPNGTSILVDAGSLKEREPKDLKDYLEAELDDDTIDMLVITHPDADHYNMLPYVVSDLTVDHVLYVGAMTDHKADANVTSASSQKDEGFYDWLSDRDSDTRTQLAASDIDDQDDPSNELFETGDVDIWIVAADVRDGSDKNSKSIVLLVSYGDFDSLLTGDATFATETAIVGTYDDWWLDVECLKLGHHGSKWTSTSDTWVGIVQPEIAISSASYTAKHGHPHNDLRARLEPMTQAADAHRIKWWNSSTQGYIVSDYTEAIYSTATNGTVVVSTDGTTVDVDYNN